MSTKLDAYLRREGISNAEFGKLISKDRSIVSKLRRGLLRPTLDVAAAIEAETSGELPMQVWIGQGDHAASDTTGLAAAASGNTDHVSAGGVA